jgi:hypothetical protein
MTTQTGPYSHGDFKSDWGHDYLFADERIRLEVEDMLNVLGLPVVELMGTFEGRGTDTLRVKWIGDVGYGRTFTALTSETDTIAASSLLSAYDSLTIGYHGMADENTYWGQMLGTIGLTLDELIQMLPATWVASVRALACTAGAAFGTDVGAVTTELSLDDLFDLDVAKNAAEHAGSRLSGAIHSAQWGQLQQSLRNEPAYQNSPQTFAEEVVSPLSGDEMILRNVAGFRLDLGVTNDVGTTGGGYDGWVGSPGAMGYGVGSFDGVDTGNNGEKLSIGQLGMLIQKLADKGNQGISRYEARVGLGLAAASLSDANVNGPFQRGLLSTT